jgi:hypothetical protein
MTAIIPSLFAFPGRMSEEVEVHSFYHSLEQLPDRRKARGKQYPLAFVLTLICLAKLAGETTISDVVDWTRKRADLFREHLHWTRSFPTNSTYTSALARPAAEQVVQIVAQVLVRARAEQEDSQRGPEISQVAMDGKAMRGTWSQAHKQREQQRAEEKKRQKQEQPEKAWPKRKMRYFDAHPSAMISLLCHRLSR